MALKAEKAQAQATDQALMKKHTAKRRQIGNWYSKRGNKREANWLSRQKRLAP